MIASSVNWIAVVMAPDTDQPAYSPSRTHLAFPLDGFQRMRAQSSSAVGVAAMAPLTWAILYWPRTVAPLLNLYGRGRMANSNQAEGDVSAIKQFPKTPGISPWAKSKLNF